VCQLTQKYLPIGAAPPGRWPPQSGSVALPKWKLLLAAAPAALCEKNLLFFVRGSTLRAVTAFPDG
jgi:hypothetical protein